MAIGLVCHYVEKQFKRNGSFELINMLKPKSFQLGRYHAGAYSESLMKEGYKHNIQVLTQYVEKIARIAGCFRLSSDMIPLHDVVPRHYWDNDELRALYRAFGDRCRQFGLRVVTHLEDAFQIAVQSWDGIKPLQHVSNTEPGMETGNFTERRRHSALIHKIPPVQLEALNNNLIDLEFETKHKNLAIEHFLQGNQ